MYNTQNVNKDDLFTQYVNNNCEHGLLMNYSAMAYTSVKQIKELYHNKINKLLQGTNIPTSEQMWLLIQELEKITVCLKEKAEVVSREAIRSFNPIEPDYSGRILLHVKNGKVIVNEELSDDMYVMTFLAFYEAIQRIEADTAQRDGDV